MARLIDADAIHKFVDDSVAEGKYGWADGVPYEWQYALAIIDYLPTVDAAPVRRGEWRVTEAWPHKVYCTNCYVTIGVSTVPGDVEAKCVPRTNFCHECGADMRGERLDGDDT